MNYSDLLRKDQWHKNDVFLIYLLYFLYIFHFSQSELTIIFFMLDLLKNTC